MKHIFLINPAQERRAMPRALSVPRLRTIAAKRVSTMRSMSQNVRATPRTTAGNTQNPAKRSASMPAADDKLVICGGDGTLYEVVNGAYGYPNCEVAVIPLGSGNDFVRLFGTKEQFCNVEAQVTGIPVELDVIKCGDKIAINQCSMGMDAEVARSSPISRRCRL